MMINTANVSIQPGAAGAQRKRRVAAFSKYLAWNMGGAEASTHELLMQTAAAGNDITIMSMGGGSMLGRSAPAAALPEDWHRIEISPIIGLDRFVFAEYVLNRNYLRRYFATLSFDELWTYGSMAPAAALGFEGPVRLFVRSESDVGHVGNYQRGVRRIAKHGHNIAQWPFLKTYQSDLRLAMARSTVIANSQFMANEVRQRFDVEAEVCLPAIDVTAIRTGLALYGRQPQDVIFVGDSSWKGLDIVLQLAQRMPGTSFKIFSRLTGHARQEGNITWACWTQEPWRIYQSARLVIVPSQCAEAYGRVSREAWLLGIPVLVSDSGGLPESVEHDANCIIEDFQSIPAWHSAVARRLVND
jgi:glycosyltransferase involved in cell wall biosynthesis